MYFKLVAGRANNRIYALVRNNIVIAHYFYKERRIEFKCRLHISEKELKEISDLIRNVNIKSEILKNISKKWLKPLHITLKHVIMYLELKIKTIWRV